MAAAALLDAADDDGALCVVVGHFLVVKSEG
jgi:hypothetical protein